MVKEMEQLSQALDKEVKGACAKNPASDACRNGVNAMTQYAAMADAWYVMNPDVKRSSNQLFDYVYNDPNAKTNFTMYYNTIDNRANFFGASDQYYQNSGVGVKWFGGAYKVSKKQLGAGDGSAFLFGLGAGAAGLGGNNLYGWRAEAGNTLMNTGFNNFKNLYNNGTNSSAAWDINQLRNEQTVLQPIHEKYLGNAYIFNPISSSISRTGVDILDYKSRVTYGCQLLGYSVKQGCKP